MQSDVIKLEIVTWKFMRVPVKLYASPKDLQQNSSAIDYSTWGVRSIQAKVIPLFVLWNLPRSNLVLSFPLQMLWLSVWSFFHVQNTRLALLCHLAYPNWNHPTGEKQSKKSKLSPWNKDTAPPQPTWLKMCISKPKVGCTKRSWSRPFWI